MAGTLGEPPTRSRQNRHLTRNNSEQSPTRAVRRSRRTAVSQFDVPGNAAHREPLASRCAARFTMLD